MFYFHLCLVLSSNQIRATSFFARKNTSYVGIYDYDKPSNQNFSKIKFFKF